MIRIVFITIPQDGWTALMYASVGGHTSYVQLLLSMCAQVDLQNKVEHNILPFSLPFTG